MALQLPTKAQIDVLMDRDAILGIKDEVDLAIDHIETQLEWSDVANGEWLRSAQNALALHRYTARLLHRRAEKLRPQQGTAERPRDLNSDDTNAWLDNGIPDYTGACDTVEADRRIAWLMNSRSRVQRDREEEIALPYSDRDEAFLSATGRLIRESGQAHQKLILERGELSRKERAQEHERRMAQEAGRQGVFVEAAKLVLDKETYLRIWQTVERIEAHPKDMRSGGDGS